MRCLIDLKIIFIVCANTMAVRSACGHGTSVGTRETERGTSMAKMQWKQEDLKRAGELIKGHTATEVGKIFNKSKNAVLGALYRDKVRNGYVPPADSKYTVTKNSHKCDSSLGEMKCYICEKTFTKSGRFDRFCYECRRTGRVT